MMNLTYKIVENITKQIDDTSISKLKCRVYICFMLGGKNDGIYVWIICVNFFCVVFKA